MKRLALLLLLCCWAAPAVAQDGAGQPAMAATDTAGDYLLGPADVIEVMVWGDQTLSRTVRIRPDGKISYPLVGEAMAAGRTIEDLRQELEKKIDEFVPKANVTVILTESASKRFYVLGKVGGPGVYPMYDAVNILQALTMAGGLGTFADEDSILILREEDGATTVLKFDYSKVVRGRDLEQNILLKSKDIVIVR